MRENYWGAKELSLLFVLFFGATASGGSWPPYLRGFYITHNDAAQSVGLLRTSDQLIIPDVVLIQLSSWGWAQSCSKHVEDSNKHIIEEIVRQVGYQPELYEDVLLLYNIKF